MNFPKLLKIEIILENCEVIEIDNSKFICDISIDGIESSVTSCNSDGSLSEIYTSKYVCITLKNVSSLTYSSFGSDISRFVLPRLKLNDVTQLNLITDKSLTTFKTDATLCVPWKEGINFDTNYAQHSRYDKKNDVLTITFNNKLNVKLLIRDLFRRVKRAIFR